MKTLNYHIAIIAMITVTLMTGCASSPGYKAANGSGYGYSETKISDDRYRVQYKARGDDSQPARDYAMLRAAELTLLQGYDWFVVVDRETQVERDQNPSGAQVSNRTVVSRDCGLLTCDTNVHQVPTYSAGVSTGSRGETEVSIEIRMGKGVRPSSGDSYDAMEVRDNLDSKR